MTTRFLNTTGIPLYKIDDTRYCKMIDVLKLIHHEYYENENDDIRRILDRMEARLCVNDLLRKTDKVEDMTCPPRYAVGKEKDGKWTFYVSTKDGEDSFSERICQAQKYLSYRDASACADFLDGEWDVIDLYDAMSEEDRWVRELRLPFPYDADDGNENSILIQIIR